MLDENLPTIYSKPSVEKPKSHSTLYNYQGGAEPEPIYSVRHLDPSSPNARNRYAIALYDPYSPDILYGEVLLIPKWTQPSLSQEAIRANGGVQPPPEPILPTEFTIQLYNPEQQILVRHKPSSWNTPATWSFEMPQQTFRQPSKSQLDRSLSDPAISDTTSRLRFNWRKDGKLSKDLGCYLSGKVVDPAGKSKKSKEPDITIAIFQALREITLYEPNFYRVEMEDFKGLEVVLMLGALVIRDVYFGQMKECFHITDPPSNPTSPVDRPTRPVIAIPSQPNAQNTASAPNQTKQAPIPQQAAQTKPPPVQPQTQPQPQPQQPPRRQQTNQKPPPTDPRTQWELDAESRALKQQAEADARERRRKEKEAEKRTQKLLQAEEKEARKRQAQIDKETERLKKLYGQEDNVSRQRQSAPPFPPRPQQPQQPPRVNFQQQPTHPTPRPAQTSIPSPAMTGGLMPPQPKMKEKRSIFGLRKKEGSSSQSTLTKKRSSMF